MEINHHFSFSLDSHDNIRHLLNKHNIPYKECYTSGIVDMSESHPAWAEVERMLNQLGRTTIKTTLFTKEELSSAQRLTVRSCWHNDYPQPVADNEYRIVTYNCEKYCPVCGSGLIQQHPFRLKKATNWGRRNFFMLNWVFDELFIDDTAKNLLQNSGLSGFSFMEVYNKKETAVIEGTYQMIIPTILPEGLVPILPAIDDIYPCEHCGTDKYHPCGRGMKIFKKEIFDNAPDIVKTSEVFGWGCGAVRLIIISQKMYQFLIKNHLDRSLCFEPVELV